MSLSRAVLHRSHSCGIQNDGSLKILYTYQMERPERYALGIGYSPRMPAPPRGDPPPIHFEIYVHSRLQTITTTSARGLMVGGSASTPHVHVDVGPIALVKPRPAGSVPPTPDPDYGDLRWRPREVRSGESVIPCNLEPQRWSMETDQDYYDL